MSVFESLRFHSFRPVHTTPILLCFQIFPLWRSFSKVCVFIENDTSFSCGRDMKTQQNICIFKWKRIRVDGASVTIHLCSRSSVGPVFTPTTPSVLPTPCWFCPAKLHCCNKDLVSKRSAVHFLLGGLSFQVRSHAIVGRTKSLPLKTTQQPSITLPQQREFCSMFACSSSKLVKFTVELHVRAAEVRTSESIPVFSWVAIVSYVV